MEIVLIVLVLAIVLSKLLGRSDAKASSDRDLSAEDEDVTWGEIKQELRGLLGSSSKRARARGRLQRERKRRPRPVPSVRSVEEMTPPSTDTTMRMRDYHSTLRPSDYILRRRQDEMEHLSHSAVSESEESLGSSLFDTEDRSRTLREAILRAEILRRRGV